MSMRIAIINLTGGGMSGGYKAYLHNILPRLAVHSGVGEVLCMAPSSLKIQAWFPPLPKITFAPCAPFRFMHHRPDASLRRVLAQFSPDAIFIPVERYYNFSKFPVVTMVQNMGPMVSARGNPFTERARYIAQRYEAKIAARNATRVIVPTKFVRDFLQQRWHIPAERMRVIHYGAYAPADVSTFRKPPLIPPAWKGNFIFTAGSIEPYRGLEDILRAFYMIQNRGMAGIVIAGEARRNMIPYYKKLKEWVARHAFSERVLWVGHLGESEISWCYRNSRAFVMTSRVESMSLIGLEALAHGCVCVAANNPPLPEIFGDAALYYPPRRADHLAQTIETVMDWSHSQYERASLGARNRAGVFSWDSNVESLVHELSEVVHEKKKPVP